MDNLETLNSRLICVWLHVFVERERNELSRNKTHVLSRPLPRGISSSRTGPPLFRISFAGRRASYKKRLLLMRWFGAGSSPTYLRRTLTNRFETLFPRGTRFRRHGTRLERGGEVKDSSALPLSSVGRSVISRFLSIIPLARTRERNPNSSCAIHCIYDIVYYSRILFSGIRRETLGFQRNYTRQGWTYLGAASRLHRFNGIRSNDVSSVALHLHKLS